MRAKRVTFTFWVDKSSFKMPKNGSFWRAFEKTVLPDRPILIGQKLEENAKIRHFEWFLNNFSLLLSNFWCGLPSWGLYILARLQGLVRLSILQFLVSPFPDKPRDQWSRYQSSNRRVCRSQFVHGSQSSRDREICANILQPELPANLGRDPIAYHPFRTQS